MKQITKDWLDRALDDLEAIGLLINAEHLTNVVSFHAQQAVEKSLKAMIEELELDFVKTHDLNRLYALVHQHIIIEDVDMLDRLNAVYTESRYPSELGLLPYGKPTVGEANTFFEFAKTIYQRTKTRLHDID